MKHFKFIVFLSLFVAFVSCDKKQEPIVRVNESDALTTDDYRKEFPGFWWLERSRNFKHPEYQDSFNYYFNSSLENKEYDRAAAYMIAYGDALGVIYNCDTSFRNKSIDFYEKYEEHFTNDTKSRLAYNLGGQAYCLNDVKDSQKWYGKAVSIPADDNYHKQIVGFSHFAMAQNYANLGEFETAEEHLIKASNIFVEVGDERNQATVYLLLEGIYSYNSAYEEAEKTIKKALDILRYDCSYPLLFSAYSSYMQLKVGMGDSLGAIAYVDTLSQMEEWNPEFYSDYDRALLSQYKVFKHIVLEDYDSSMFYLDKAREITDKMHNPDIKMRTLFQEASVSNHFKKPLKDPAAIEAFYEELASDEVQNRQYMSQMASALLRYYEITGDYAKASKYSRFLINDVSKLAEDRMKGRLFELEKKFELEIKENKILLQQKEIDERNKLIVSLAVGIVFLILVFLLIIVWIKNRSINKEKVLTQNFASQLLFKTEEERKRIASDLHDSVSNELVNLRHAITVGNLSVKEKIDNILEEVRNISRNISPTLFDRVGLKESVEQLTERIQNQHQFFLTSEVNYSGTLEKTKELQIYRIIQEAITNTLKHAEAVAGKIDIYEDDKNVYVKVKDNGKGFDVDTMLEKGNCFGLLNITERAKYLNGTAQFKSGKEGTEIMITIPK